MQRRPGLRIIGHFSETAFFLQFLLPFVAKASRSYIRPM